MDFSSLTLFVPGMATANRTQHIRPSVWSDGLQLSPCGPRDPACDINTFIQLLKSLSFFQTYMQLIRGFHIGMSTYLLTTELYRTASAPSACIAWIKLILWREAVNMIRNIGNTSVLDLANLGENQRAV